MYKCSEYRKWKSGIGSKDVILIPHVLIHTGQFTDVPSSLAPWEMWFQF